MLAALTNLSTLNLSSHASDRQGNKGTGPAEESHQTRLERHEGNGCGRERTDVYLKNLTDLRSDNTQVTDAGLKELAALKNLSTLDLWSGTKVTDAGVEGTGRTQEPHHLRLGIHKGDGGGGEGTGALKNLTDTRLSIEHAR